MAHVVNLFEDPLNSSTAAQSFSISIMRAKDPIFSTSLLHLLFSFFFPPVQFSSVGQSCPTLCNPVNRSTPGLPVHHQESVMPSSHLILCHPLLLLPPIPPSIRVFSNESTLRMRWPKYWSFSFSIISSKERRSGLMSFRMDWLDLLAVQGTLKSLRAC